MTGPDTKTYARSRIVAALREIERAQESLRHAAELLSPITGFVREWEATCKLSFQAQRHWHKVNTRQRFDYDLDESSRRAFAEGRSI